jgi:NAD(P)-dependent dehydrogenase (short-subunit alcohol dehydrogenase family)
MRLKDKVAIITGGGRGIGEAISLQFAKEGAIVVLAARDLSGLEATADKIRSIGGRVHVAVTDVRHEDQIKQTVTSVLEKYRSIDILVNNAAVGGPTVNFVALELSDWQDVMAINITGPMLFSKEVLKHMIPRKTGNIINIGSEGGRSGFPMRGPYAVSKRGIMALTETLAIEVGEYNIRVNCVSPGRVKGERVKNVIRDKAKALGIDAEDVMKDLLIDSSMKRLVEPDEVASAVVYLASDESSAITGHTLVVSCGKHMMH